ncbi:MAG: hypothetical protein ABSB70_22775 [Candidatus Velthaea sp.]|jgi:hypothetical protein
MPFSMPMWPLVLSAVPSAAIPGTAIETGKAVRRRWLIVDDNVRIEVEEPEFQAAAGASSRVEVERDPHGRVVTSVCFRAAPR